MKFRIRILITWIVIVAMIGCRQKPETLFSVVENAIDFENTITEDESHNIMLYEYFYNGGGVGAGDFNNDGLCDLYFTANQTLSKLYINKGNFLFEEIGVRAGVSGENKWSTGVSVVDINGDGWLDIYVSRSGTGTKDDRSNALFINNGCEQGGIPTFKDNAKEFGLEAPGTFTTQTTFFDYDRDGDLDAFMVNHADMFYEPFANTKKLRQARHPYFGNRLYRNDNNHFTDISKETGILGSGLNFGLSAAISDFNQDGWPDIYVTNDYEEQDFLYINTQDGKFKESLKNSFGHISKYSMGTDVADINNDTWPDLISLDMLPEDNKRQKMLKGPDQYDRYQLAVDSGYHHQNMRNMLHLNQGVDENGIPLFSEIGQLAGIQGTDWSWSALLADFDNDGLRDLYITNGYLRDFTNMDFLKYTVEDERRLAQQQGKKMVLFDLVKKMPSTAISNYSYQNTGQLSFNNQTNNWGLQQNSIATGAVYVDLDNDGDLDLVTNNINARAGLYRNNANKISHNNFIRIRLHGTSSNVNAIGSKVYVSTDSAQYFAEANSIRGFQSSVENVVHIGLGKTKLVNAVRVVWPDGHETTQQHVLTNATIDLYQSNSVADKSNVKPMPPSLLKDVTNATLLYQHHENSYVDFKYTPLIPYQLSRRGPCIAKADVNGDGREDIFMGGGKGQQGELLLATKNGKFLPSSRQPWISKKNNKIVAVAFFDADNDRDQDIYIAYGANEAQAIREELQDQLYLNEGGGNFSITHDNVLPKMLLNESCLMPCDYDKDGDVDLFVGGHVKPGQYPIAEKSWILRNDTYQSNNLANIKFTAVEIPLLPEGILKDATWADVDNDGWDDIIMVGEWMPITIYKNRQGVFESLNSNTGTQHTHGLWNNIVCVDVDQDGDKDFLMGNMGLNTSWAASQSSPLKMYLLDADKSGRIIPVIANYVQDKSYPIASRDELLDQFPSLRKKFIRYADYADATIETIFTVDQHTTKPWHANTLSSSLLRNNGKGYYTLEALPRETQFSCVNSFVCRDLTGDSILDVLAVGNFYPMNVQLGRSDASYGSLLVGNRSGNFTALSRITTGLSISGDVRKMLVLNDSLLITGVSNGPSQVFKISPFKSNTVISIK